MLQPFLLVGVGGSGGKTLRAVKHALELRLQQEDWKEGWPKAWQFLHIDSPTAQDGAEFPAPFLKSENYMGLVSAGTTYQQAYGSVLANIPSQYVPDIKKALPSDEDVKVSVYIGAGKYRAVGRTLVLAKMRDVVTQIEAATSRMTSDGAITQLDTLAEFLGAKASKGAHNPVVIVVSSIAGGSGAGQFIEVTEAIKFANSYQPWVHNIFSILYAPDVFESVGNTDVIAPNALFAMAESMAGMWSNDLPVSTQELYKKLGITIPGLGTDPKVHVGPKFNYVIGRQNSKVSFSDQPDVYKAVAASISTWMTDEKVQDGLQAYTIANFDANSGALNLTDNSGLQVANKDTPPFGSLGFGRVSLGRDKFTDYVAERLTRTAIDRMLNAHSKDAGQDSRTVEELVNQKATQSIGQFIVDMNLTRRSETEFEVIQSTRPSRESFLEDFKSQIKGIAAQALSPKTGTQPANSWFENLSAGYEIRFDDAHRVEQGMREESLRAWVKAIRLRTLKVVAQSASQVGLKVTVELLKRLQDEIEVQVSLIHRVRDQYAAYGADYRGAISASLQSVQGGSGLKEDHEAVLSAIENAKNVLWYNLDSKFHNEVAGLLSDFVANFLAPLRQVLNQGELALIKQTDRQASDDVQNAYLTWPKPDSEAVPPKYKPAPNEYLLVKISEYPSEYSRLVRESVPVDRRESAVQVVTDEVLMGALGLDNLDPAQRWQLITESRPWIPLDAAYRSDRSQSQQTAHFLFSSDPEEYLERTHLWLQRKGQNFYKYLHEDLATYLDPNQANQAEFLDRQTKFREAFVDAARASEPLVKLNPGLLQELHDTSIEDRQTVVSVLPFDTAGPIHQLVSEVLRSEKIIRDGKSADDWFNSSARVQSIDIFSVQKPYQPIVMESIFGPVASSWNVAKNKFEKREDFLKWRRSRLLFETMPAAPSKKYAMLRGWYVARVLSQLQVSEDDPLLGPELKVWSGKTYDFVSFPHPLANDTLVEPRNYPGALMNSLSIALALCNSENSLKPLFAYQRLMELGDEPNKTNSELALWILKGKLRYQGQPDPRPDRAGSPGEGSEAIEERRSRVVAHLQEISSEFKENVEGLDPRTQRDELDLTWELREAIRKSLDELISAAKSVRMTSSGI